MESRPFTFAFRLGPNPAAVGFDELLGDVEGKSHSFRPQGLGCFASAEALKYVGEFFWGYSFL